MNSALRVVIAHDYLTQRGGAERVVLAATRAFPSARVVTSIYNPATTFPEFENVNIETSSLQRIGAFREDPRRAVALLPLVWQRTSISDADVVIASSAGFAHGVTTSAPKIVYCHNPPRWLHQSSDYLIHQNRTVRFASRMMAPYLKHFDKKAARSADRYLANSRAVASRIQKAYGFEARVIHPPVSIDASKGQQPFDGIPPGFLLTVARRRGYKNTSLAAEAAELLPRHRLIVVGDLPPHPLGRPWDDRITSVGRVNDDQLRWLYANCSALVAPAYEDFGLTPLEAAHFGKPTVALRAGGYLETIRHGVTGLLVDEPEPRSFADAIDLIDSHEMSATVISQHASEFSEPLFAALLHATVEEALIDSRAGARGQAGALPSSDRRAADLR